MPNPLISQITLQNGTTYDLKDAQAREDIAELQQSLVNGVSYLGETTTVISDGSTTNTILIDGKTVTAEPGDIVTYQESEFIFGKVSLTWREFGSTGALKALAFKSSASGKVTPTGTISAPTFTGTATVLRATVATSGNVTISTGSGTANYTPAGTVSRPTFTGTQGTVSSEYTPEGSVSTPTITVTANTTTVNSITDVGTLPSCTLPEMTATVSGEVLTLNFTEGSFSAGTLPTKGANTTVATGIKSASSSTPTFTGSAATISANYTPAGTVSQPTFTGTGVDLEAQYNGSSADISINYTPEGTVSAPVFTGDELTVTVS